MLTAQQIADFAAAAAHDAVERVVSFSQTDAVAFENWHAPGQALYESWDRDTPVGRSTWEFHAAHEILMAVQSVVDPYEGDETDDAPDPDDGYRMLREGDHAGALAVADALLLAAENTTPDDWNHGNLLHHAHVLRGKVSFAEGNLPAAAVELVAAGNVPGSPQLDSFGPDLSLAWSS